MDVNSNWTALGRAVKARRESLRLGQDLIDHGGPSDLTIRKIERGETRAIRNKTRDQLESALRWMPGTVDKVLSGALTADLAAALPQVAHQGGVSAVALHGESSLTVGRRDGRVANDRPSGSSTSAATAPGFTVAPKRPAKDVMISLGSVESAAAAQAALESVARNFAVHEAHLREALGDTVEIVREAVRQAVASGPDEEALAGWLRVRMPDANTRVVTFPMVELPVLPDIPVLPEIPAGLSDLVDLRADVDSLKEWQEVKRQTWFDPEAQPRDQRSRYREEQARSVGQGKEPDRSGSVDQTPVRGDEPTEVVLGPWGVIVEHQQNLSDVDDLALASELFARVARRPRSDDRVDQLRVMNALIGELVTEAPHGPPPHPSR
ncbi:MAG: hypothetical protein IVW52_20465 [Acidimicrobiales bacterium]|nr:hypothetical protein [Acidimicrobiales bacterium]